MAVTTVRLKPEVEKKLDSMAQEQRRSKSWLINQAIFEYVDRQELEKQRWQETLGAMELAARGKVVASDEVHDWLRSWGDSQELPPPKPGQ